MVHYSHTKINISLQSLYKQTVLHNIQLLKYTQSEKTSDTNINRKIAADDAFSLRRNTINVIVTINVT